MDNRTLNQYMAETMGIILMDVIKHTLKNPKETAFLLKYKDYKKQFDEIRHGFEEKGEHIPIFLISSITEDCNLFCKGCYARANGICGDDQGKEGMTATQWDSIFKQAVDLGIPFHLLAGGEPLMRRDVLEAAAKYPQVIFPVFTNGTLVKDDYLDFFNQHRNMVPILSLEGTADATDSRRGHGTFATLTTAMKHLKKGKILFGASLTVTTKNLSEVTSESFIRELFESGCRFVLFIEYTPVAAGSENLVLSPKQREHLAECQQALRNDFKGMVFLSFPGDEKHMGGCLGAGRGFFHINPKGKAEACPFSPYSDRDLKTHTLREALQSPLFQQLKEMHLVGGDHDGGCALFEHQEQVKELLEKK